MIKSQFPHHPLSYVRSEWTKVPQDTTKDIQFFKPSPQPLIGTPPTYLLSDLFQPFPFIATPFYSERESTQHCPNHFNLLIKLVIGLIDNH